MGQFAIFWKFIGAKLKNLRTKMQNLKNIPMKHF